MDLRHIKVASPCSARWEDMEGDDRCRFCRHCSKNVYNFTAMSTPEIESLIREKGGKVCARFYQRADGTMLLENCPRGAMTKCKPIVRIAVAAVFGLILYATSVLARRDSENKASSVARSAQTHIDGVIGTVKGWLGMNPPMMVMGAVCPVPVTPQPPLTNGPICTQE
jgi:hypothetical protein